MLIEAVDDRLDLGLLAASIRRSSNFRFAWRFFSVHADDLHSIRTVATILGTILQDAKLHEFLSNSLDDVYPHKFTMEPLHRHAAIVVDEYCFLDTMARASLDRLGAYSRNRFPSTADERNAVKKLFSRLGRYFAYTIQPGAKQNCAVCQQGNNHLFSNWFFGVVWDYTFLLIWPHASLCWMGCLTDTD